MGFDERERERNLQSLRRKRSERAFGIKE